jgi:hypothetical protein
MKSLLVLALLQLSTLCTLNIKLAVTPEKENEFKHLTTALIREGTDQTEVELIKSLNLHSLVHDKTVIKDGYMVAKTWLNFPHQSAERIYNNSNRENLLKAFIVAYVYLWEFENYWVNTRQKINPYTELNTCINDIIYQDQINRSAVFENVIKRIKKKNNENTFLDSIITAMQEKGLQTFTKNKELMACAIKLGADAYLKNPTIPGIRGIRKELTEQLRQLLYNHTITAQEKECIIEESPSPVRRRIFGTTYKVSKDHLVGEVTYGIYRPSLSDKDFYVPKIFTVKA